MGYLKIEAKNLMKISKQLERTVKPAQKVINRTIGDIKGSVPGIVADAVRTVYNIQKQEITPVKKKPKKTAGKIYVNGVTLDTAAIVYRGRGLTPNAKRFSMTPKTPPTERIEKKKRIPSQHLKMTKISSGRTGGQYAMIRPLKPYRISVTIKKGRKKILGEEAFLAIKKQDGGTNYVPFLRHKKNGNPRGAIRALTTVSLPQMVDNPDVRKVMVKAINKKIETRLANHMKQFLK